MALTQTGLLLCLVSVKCLKATPYVTTLLDEYANVWGRPDASITEEAMDREENVDYEPLIKSKEHNQSQRKMSVK